MLAGLTLCVLLLPGRLEAAAERVISLYNVHTKETLSIAYKRHGRYVPAALKKLNWHLRDWRRNAPTKMDPKLIDLVWEIHAELGSRVPVHVISAYRSPATNTMLRRTRGGQARRSQHLLGKAMDVRFPDVPVRRLRYSALLREQGGVGYYPTSATPFVHVDTGRVRHWPRMRRQELALLFPHGRTRHRPRGGGSISPTDAVTARRHNPVLAKRVASFHVARRNGTLGSSRSTRVAAAYPRSALPPPRLLQGPRLQHRSGRRPLPATAVRYYPPKMAKQRSQPRQRVAALNPAPLPFRPARASLGGWQATTRSAPPPPASRQQLPASKRSPSSETASSGRRRLPAAAGRANTPAPLPLEPRDNTNAANDPGALKRLASLIFGAPKPSDNRPLKRTVTGPDQNEWVNAPAYDEEHPEELFYRPFPIAPFITQTASADDPELIRMHAPEIARTLVMLVDHGAEDPLSTWQAQAPLNALQAFSRGATGVVIHNPPQSDQRAELKRSRMNQFARTASSR